MENPFESLLFFLAALAGLAACAEKPSSAGSSTSSSGTGGTPLCPRDAAPKPVHISADDKYTGVIMSDGSYWCWGDSLDGVCNQADEPRVAYVPVRGATLGCLSTMRVRALSPVGLRADGVAVQWGNLAPWMGSTSVPLGGSTTIDLPEPMVEVDGYGVLAVGVGKSGALYHWDEWGSSALAPLHTDYPAAVSGLRKVVHASSGGGAICIIDELADLYCWGHNQAGELGDGTTQDNFEGPKTPVLSQVDAVVAAGPLSCARRAGELWCWGSNVYGGVGNGTLTPSPSPSRVLDLPNVAGMSVSEVSACAWTEAGELYCWGENGYKSFGDIGTRQTKPVLVDFGGPVREAATAGSHLCAIRQDDTVWCRGSQEYLGTDSAPNEGPIQVTFSP